MPPSVGAGDKRKVTPGVTGVSRVKVQIDLEASHSAVGSPYPAGVYAGKGEAVRLSKRIVSWV